MSIEKVRRKIRDRNLSKDDLLEGINREVIPVLRELRQRFNELVSGAVGLDDIPSTGGALGDFLRLQTIAGSLKARWQSLVELAALSTTGGNNGETVTLVSGVPSWSIPLATAAMFGDGSDGDVTLSSGTLGPTRKMYYRNLTPMGGRISSSYPIFVSDTLDLSNSLVAAVANSGSGGAASAGVPGGVGASGGSGVDFGVGTNGVTGSAGAVGAGGTPANPVAGNNGGGGGGTRAGGSSGATLGGGALAGVVPTNTDPVNYWQPIMTRGTVLCTAGTGGRGGASGAGDGANAGGGGGGGAGSGGNGFLSARKIKTSALTPQGVIAYKGGKGGKGGAGSAGNAAGGSGGGGGGGGDGHVFCWEREGPTVTGGIDVSGGDGGDGGAGSGTGLGGGGGDGAAGGRLLYQIFSTGTSVTTFGIPGTLGNTTATPVAATGGAGNVVQVDL